MDRQVSSAWREIPGLANQVTSRFRQLVDSIAVAAGIAYDHPPEKPRQVLAQWHGWMRAITAESDIVYDHPVSKHRQPVMPWLGTIPARCAATRLNYDHPPAKPCSKSIAWGPVWYPRVCWWQYAPPPGDAVILGFPPVCYGLLSDGGNLILNGLSTGYEYVCEGGTWNGPKDPYWYQPKQWGLPVANIQRVYVAMNNVRFYRLSDGADIPFSRVDVSCDRDSWAWSFSVTLLGTTARDMVSPHSGIPVEVGIDINGHTWQCIAERPRESREFGRNRYTVSGRSLSAYLADPYYRPESYEETALSTANQLADAVVDGTGWTIDWQLTDWLVQAGCWGYQDKTPMQALLQLAQAVGGVVSAPMQGGVLTLEPYYTLPPWQWETAVPEVNIPADLMRMADVEWQPSPEVNGVWVAGQQSGLQALVKRYGTDGAVLGQMVVDPLICATEAAEQRGRHILSGSGNRQLLTAILPVFDNPGLILPGMIAQVSEPDGSSWRGQVMSTAVSAEKPHVMQRIGVVRYYGS